MLGAECWVHRRLSNCFIINILYRNLRQNLDTADTRSHAKISPLLAVFHSHHRGSAAYPLFYAVSEFRRQNQDHLQFAPLRNARVGIEENSTGVQVTGEAAGVTGTRLRLTRLGLTGLRLNGNGHARGKALSGTAFALSIRHENRSLPQRRRE